MQNLQVSLVVIEDHTTKKALGISIAQQKAEILALAQKNDHHPISLPSDDAQQEEDTNKNNKKMFEDEFVQTYVELFLLRIKELLSKYGVE